MIDSSMILKATFEKIIESINIGIFDLLHTGVALFCDKGFFIYCNIRKGMRVSRVCAWNTSRLAYDGSIATNLF